MMRVCHLDTCPVGVATQNPALRQKFMGDPSHVVNFMKFIAQQVRELMAELGFRTVDEMIGRTDLLETSKAVSHWKAKGVDLAPLLYQPDVDASVGRFRTTSQDHGLELSLDMRELLKAAQPALENGTPVTGTFPIYNINRVVGTILGSEVTRKYGAQGLPADTIKFHFTGSAGQSFGAFMPKGMTLTLEGDANDYVGKGLSGGKIAVYPSPQATFKAEENIIIGNVAFYGATGGEAYIRGVAGERFCVRNSGVHVVVEGVGDHGCEYMTGGKVVVLGRTGRNFAAGMSGGIAYVLDADNDLAVRMNYEMVTLERLAEQDADEIDGVKAMIAKHIQYTSSTNAQNILDNWNDFVTKIVKVIPKDYKRMLEAIDRVKKSGLSNDEAVLVAFEENMKDLSRVGGN
jgi:glutamate synthase (ferredoxin)